MPRTTANSMGKRLKECRERKGYSQEEAARLAGIIQVTYSRYEGDKVKYPPAGIVERLATLYGVTVDYLTGAEDGLAHLPKEVRDFLRDDDPATVDVIVNAYMDYKKKILLGNRE